MDLDLLLIIILSALVMLQELRLNIIEKKIKELEKLTL